MRYISENGPAIIIPSKNGKTHHIQYGGCACYQHKIKGKLFVLPPMRFGDEQGSIFNPSFWYAHVLSHLFDKIVGDFEGKKAGANFLYGLIDKEIES